MSRSSAPATDRSICCWAGSPATCADSKPSLEHPVRHRTQPLPATRPVARPPRRTAIVPTCSLQIPVRGRHAHADVGTITRSEQSALFRRRNNAESGRSSRSYGKALGRSVVVAREGSSARSCGHGGRAIGRRSGTGQVMPPWSRGRTGRPTRPDERDGASSVSYRRGETQLQRRP